MKNYLFILLFAITFPTSAFAFDYHGIKSGMTKDQISKVLSGLGVNKAPSEVSSPILVQLKGVAIGPSLLSMEYDYEGKLYKLELIYTSFPKDVNAVALHQAITEKYKAEIEIEGGSLTVTIVDEKRMLKNILHYKNEYIGEI